MLKRGNKTTTKGESRWVQHSPLCFLTMDSMWSSTSTSWHQNYSCSHCHKKWYPQTVSQNKRSLQSQGGKQDTKVHANFSLNTKLSKWAHINSTRLREMQDPQTCCFQWKGDCVLCSQLGDIWWCLKSFWVVITRVGVCGASFLCRKKVKETVRMHRAAKCWTILSKMSTIGDWDALVQTPRVFISSSSSGHTRKTFLATTKILLSDWY